MKRTEENLCKHLRMEMGQRELQGRREMLRKELVNKSCQSNGRFSKDQAGFCQRLRELWEVRAQEQAWEEGVMEETLASSRRKTSQRRDCSQDLPCARRRS